MNRIKYDTYDRQALREKNIFGFIIVLKVSKNAPKVFKSEPKWRKIGRNWYYVHFETKNT